LGKILTIEFLASSIWCEDVVVTSFHAVAFGKVLETYQLRDEVERIRGSLSI